MQTKTIKKVIKNKLDAWVGSITDENVKKLVIKNTIVTGGAIASMLLKEEVNDYDIYFKNKETVKAVAEYYVKEAASGDLRVLDGAIDSVENEYDDVWGVKTQMSIALNSLDEKRIKIFIPNTGFWKPKDKKTEETKKEEAFDVKFISPNAITLSDKVQIIVRFYGTPEEIHANYDFIHASNYYDYSENKLFTKKDALESLLTKQLKYVGSLYPITSIIRTRKFIKRGWNISASGYLKMCYQVSLLDLSDIEVLEEQLIGIDVAYFGKLIEILKKTKHKDENFSPTFSWIVTVLDKIFNEPVEEIIKIIKKDVKNSETLNEELEEVPEEETEADVIAKEKVKINLMFEEIQKIRPECILDKSQNIRFGKHMASYEEGGFVLKVDTNFNNSNKEFWFDITERPIKSESRFLMYISLLKNKKEN